MSHAIFQNPLLSLEISMKTETIHISKQTIQVSSWNIDTNVLVVSRVFSRKKKKRFRRESQAKQEEYKECDGKRKSVLLDSRQVPGELEGASPLNQKALEKYEAVVWKAASTWSLSLSLSGWRTSHGDTRLCAQSGSRPVSMLTY